MITSKISMEPGNYTTSTFQEFMSKEESSKPSEGNVTVYPSNEPKKGRSSLFMYALDMNSKDGSEAAFACKEYPLVLSPKNQKSPKTERKHQPPDASSPTERQLPQGPSPFRMHNSDLDYLKQFPQLTSIPENTAFRKITGKKESEMYYKKYQLKNNPQEKMKPFYKWKDGFIESLLKSNGQMNQDTKAQPENDNRNELTFRSGNYNCKSVDSSQELVPKQQSKHIEGLKSKLSHLQRDIVTSSTPLEKPVVGSDYALKSSLFNKQDKILPKYKYYYNHNGDMQQDGRKRKSNGVRSFIEKTEKNFALAQLTQEFGNKASMIMSEIEDQKGVKQDSKIKEEYSCFRINPSGVDLNQTMPQSINTAELINKLNFQLQVSSTQVKEIAQITQGTGFISSPYDQSYRGSFMNTRSPIQAVNVRLNKVRIYLNALTEDGRFECKHIRVKIADLIELDIPAFLNMCEDKFEFRTALKYIFGEDGAPITNIQTYFYGPGFHQDIFVSTYPYFIGQKEVITFNPLDGLSSLEVAQRMSRSKVQLVSDPSKIAASLENELSQLSPCYPPLKGGNPQEVLLLLKQRNQSPSILAKRTEFKPTFKSAKKSLQHSPIKTTFFGKAPIQVGQQTTRAFGQQSFKKSGAFSIDGGALNSERLSKLTMFPQLGVTQNDTKYMTPFNQSKKNTVECQVTITDRGGAKGVTHRALSDISFKDYVGTFSNDDEFSQKPYAKFYSNAIRKHREQLYTQMSVMNEQKEKFRDNLRISEEDMILPHNTQVKLGELLNRENERNLQGTQFSMFSQLDQVTRSGNGLILKTLEATDTFQPMRVVPSNDNIIQVVQLANDEEELTKLQRISAEIIERCLLVTSRIALINREALFASLLGHWFMRYKGQERQQELSQAILELETKLFNSIRQANIQSANRKSFKAIQLEVKSLRSDLQGLFLYLSRRASSQKEITVQPHNDITELVQAVGLTKLDVEGYGTRLSQQISEYKESQFDDTSISGDIGQNATILQPRVEGMIRTGAFGIKAIAKEPALNSTLPKIDISIEQDQYDYLFGILSQALFSKDELQVIRQMFHTMVFAMGSTSSLNLKTLKVLNDETLIFTDPDVKEVYCRLINMPHLLEDKMISWNEYLEIVSHLRMEKLIKQMLRQAEDKKLQSAMFKATPTGDGGSTRKQLGQIFDLIVEESLDEPDVYFTACLHGSEALGMDYQRAMAENVIPKHIELVFLLLLLSL